MALVVKHATLNNGAVPDDPNFPVGPDEWDEAHTVTGTLPATGITVTPAGGIAATDVQAALEELDSEIIASPLTTRGDLLRRGATLPERFALGASGYQLQSDGTDPVWAGFVQAGAGAVTRTWQNKLRDNVSVKDFGAVGDGVTDDTAAIQAAIDYVESIGGGTVFLPTGVYLTSATLTADARGVIIAGAGRDATEIKASHTSGAVIRVKLSYSGVRGLKVTATEARIAAAFNATNSGIWFETDDIAEPAPSNRMWACSIMDVFVRDQPGHGFLFVHTTYLSTVERCQANANKGHGFVVGYGPNETGRSIGLLPCGVMTFTNCFGFDNLGHAFVAGHPDDTVVTPTLRVVLINFDCGRNAIAAGTRYQVDQVYMRGVDHYVLNSAFADHSTGNSSGSIAVSGKSIQLINNRFLNGDSGSRCVRILGISGFPTEGIYIEGITNVGTSVSPAVVCDTTDISNVKVTTYQDDNITSVITPNIPGSDINFAGARTWSGSLLVPTIHVGDTDTTLERVAAGRVSVEGNELARLASGNIFTGGLQTMPAVRSFLVSLADDTATSINIGTAAAGSIIVVASNIIGDGRLNGIFFARCAATSNSASNIALQTTNNIIFSTGVLTGTTGADGNFIVSANTDGLLYFENRRGASMAHNILVIGPGA